MLKHLYNRIIPRTLHTRSFLPLIRTYTNEIPQHETPQYETAQHETPQYETPQYETPQHGIPQYETRPLTSYPLIFNLSNTRVYVDSEIIQFQLQTGEDEEDAMELGVVRWDDLYAITIRTTDQGPYQQDVFFDFHDTQSVIRREDGKELYRPLSIPNDAIPGMDDLLEMLEQKTKSDKFYEILEEMYTSDNLEKLENNVQIIYFDPEKAKDRYLTDENEEKVEEMKQRNELLISLYSKKMM